MATNHRKAGNRQSVWRGVRPLLIVGLGGVLGILVDLDHPLKFLGVVPSFRSFHPVALLVGGILGGAVVAYIGGLLVKTLLERRQK